MFRKVRWRRFPTSGSSRCAAFTIPRKITLASLEIVDTPGLSRTHEGNAARLALIREAGCLLLTVAAFGGADPLVDLRTFEEDLLLADLDIVSGRVQRLEESVKKPRPKDQREAEEHEMAALQDFAGDAGRGQACARGGTCPTSNGNSRARSGC